MKTKTVRELIEKLPKLGLLRYAPDELDFDQDRLQLELRRTPMSGVEFGYNPTTDSIEYAWQSIDGVDLEPHEFIIELAEAVGENPVDYLTPEQKRAFVNGEDPLDALIDEDLFEDETAPFLVTEKTTVDAKNADDAIEKVVNRIGNQEVVSQEAVLVADTVTDLEQLDQAQDEAIDEVIYWALEVVQARAAENLAGDAFRGDNVGLEKAKNMLKRFILEFPRSDA